MKILGYTLRRGQAQLFAIAVVVIVVAVLSQIGQVTINEINTSMAASNTDVSTISVKGQNSLDTVATWLKIVTLVTCAGFALRLLGVDLLGAFQGGKSGL